MTIKISELEELIRNCLLQNYGQEDVDLMTDVVMFGELSGKTSHGIVRVATGSYSILAQRPSDKPTLIRRTKLSRLIESNGNPGMFDRRHHGAVPPHRLLHMAAFSHSLEPTRSHSGFQPIRNRSSLTWRRQPLVLVPCSRLKC